MSYEKKGAYGKRPLWQWIVIYVIIGAIVYGLIYYFAFANGGYKNMYKTGSTQQQNNSGY